MAVQADPHGKLSFAIREAGVNPDAQQRLRNVSQRVLTSTPAEMAAVMREDYDTYAKLIEKAAIKAE